MNKLFFITLSWLVYFNCAYTQNGDSVIIDIYSTDFVAEEATSTASFTVVRSGSTETPLVVSLSFDGTAQNGIDYVAMSEQIEFGVGQAIQTLVVNPLRDGISDDKETVIISIQDNSNYSIGMATATIQIRDEGFIGEGIIVPLTEDETFNLNSLPGADITIYLNFAGGVHESGITVGPLSVDDDPTTYSAEDLFEIQRIYVCVAEDFRPFNVNVTTVPPSAEMIIKSDENDLVYGGECLIGPASSGFGLGGSQIASAGTGPGYVTYDGAWAIAASGASHELGHMLALPHHFASEDPTVTDGYYYGHQSAWGSWNAIMGASTWATPAQWSNGDFPNSLSNDQDDLAVITNEINGVEFRVDDHGDDQFTSTELVELDNGLGTLFAQGIIEQNTDTDWFKFTHPGGNLQLRVDPLTPVGEKAVSPNLDVGATLYDASLNEIQNIDSSEAFLWANIYESNLDSGTYYLKVEGVGSPFIAAEDRINISDSNVNGDVLGYSDYGSLGGYTISSDKGAIVRFETIWSDSQLTLETFNADSDLPNDVTISPLNVSNLGNYQDNGSWVFTNWEIYDEIYPEREYIGFSITPDTNVTLSLTNFQLWTGIYQQNWGCDPCTFAPSNWVIRTSLDNFTTDVDIVSQAELGRKFPVEFDISSLPSIDSQIEFRIYLVHSSPVGTVGPTEGNNGDGFSKIFMYLTGWKGYAYDNSLGIQLNGMVNRLGNNLSTSNNNPLNLTPIKIYPNPTNSVINIDVGFKFSKAKIFDLTGRKILTTSNKMIDLNHLKTGVYLLTLYDDSNKVLQSSKVVKK